MQILRSLIIIYWRMIFARGEIVVLFIRCCFIWCVVWFY